MEGLIEFGGNTSSAPRRSRRSKGCLTCRKRKVKCDEAKPVCERCRNGFHTCLGYDEARIFVNSGPGLSATMSAPAEVSHARIRNPTQRQNQELSLRFFPQLGVSTTPSSNVPRKSDSEAPSTCDSPPDIRIAPTLKLDGFRDGIVISHLLLKFQAIVEGNESRATDAPTFAGVFFSGDRQSTAYISGLGVAEALFGQMHCDESLIQHSAILYGRALKRLQSDLQNIQKDSVRARSYMNLWSSTFLGIYELMTASTPMSWLEHSRGLAALTQSLGPEAFQEHSARRLFQSNRLFIVTAGVATRKRSFLEEDRWKTVPWAADSTVREIGNSIQDIFCDIPGYMEDFDLILAESNRDRSHDLSVLQAKIMNAYAEIELLRWRWEEEFPNVCWEIPVTPSLPNASDECDPLLFPTVLQFTNFDRAIEAIYFNVIRLLLHERCAEVGLPSEGLFQMCSAASRPDGPFSNALTQPGQGTIEDFALDICRSVQYMVRGDRDSLGALALMFPLRIASNHLSNHPHIQHWLDWVLSKLAARKGFKLGEHVMKMHSAHK